MSEVLKDKRCQTMFINSGTSLFHRKKFRSVTFCVHRILMYSQAFIGFVIAGSRKLTVQGCKPYKSTKNTHQLRSESQVCKVPSWRLKFRVHRFQDISNSICLLAHWVTESRYANIVLRGRIYLRHYLSQKLHYNSK